MQIAKAGTLYFAFVFGIGFMFGSIRTLWVVPRAPRVLSNRDTLTLSVPKSTPATMATPILLQSA